MIFLGVGSAFTMQNRQSNIVIENDDGKYLLIDAGTDIRHSLWRVGLSHLNIDSVYITHLHADHIGGLEWLGFLSYFDSRYINRPKLFISNSLHGKLWNNALSAGMESLSTDTANINTYFESYPIGKNGSFSWGETEFCPIQTIHVVNCYSIENSFGLLFDVNGIKIFYTSDTQFVPNQLKDFYNVSDFIFHDCETYISPSGVHAHYNELKTLPKEIKSKMWLYHYNDGELPNAIKDGFIGFVRQGQVFDFLDLESFKTYKEIKTGMSQL